jgi:RNA polymerase sigma-70 factor (ECF subfamily)
LGEPEPMTFEEVYATCGEKILNLAHRMTLREDVARDLTQEIFLKVYTNLERFKQQSHIFTWVHRIALNHILDFLKHEKRYLLIRYLETDVNGSMDGRTGATTVEPGLSTPPADAEIEQSERETIVRECLQSLPVKYRVPFLLFHYEEMSYRQIAELTHLSQSAVESRIHRARKKLIEKLEPWMDKI